MCKTLRLLRLCTRHCNPISSQRKNVVESIASVQWKYFINSIPVSMKQKIKSTNIVESTTYINDNSPFDV